MSQARPNAQSVLPVTSAQGVLETPPSLHYLTSPEKPHPSKRGEQPWQALLDSAGEGIWGVDLEGHCTFVNRAALRMLGFEAAELVGTNHA